MAGSPRATSGIEPDECLGERAERRSAWEARGHGLSVAAQSAVDDVDDDVDDVSVPELVDVLDGADDPEADELDELDPDEPPRLSVL